ncbi:U3 small nucleolar ribonucleoprotein complex, subunit Mpp10 [Sporodiniella umbellata]|nr:U3 small nucleolar ribonucleoprotein complex, subunit Mpp10 [Sporodiniella umbellata]
MSPTKVMDQFVSSVVTKPQLFFTEDKAVEAHALQIAKHCYDQVKKIEPVECSPFSELLIEGFDNDQIWEEIATQNEPFLDYARSTLKILAQGFAPHARDETTRLLDESMDVDTWTSEGEESTEEALEESTEEALEESTEEALEEATEVLEEASDDTMEESDGEEIGEAFDDEKRGSQKKSEVDDDFFSLAKFNQWTEEQEELDMKSDREDDGFDFDEDMDGLEDSEEDDLDVDDLNYDAFYGQQSRPKPKKAVRFRAPDERESRSESRSESESESRSESRSESESDKGKVRNLFEEEEEEEEESEKSNFQKQQERLLRQIEQYEDENVQDKHWTLRGEATANARPVNSLLEEDLEFEHANKPVPVITEEVTQSLEELIKKRILDNMFDDVERKADPTLRPFLPSKRVELKDERSKKSLAEIYEDDFSKQKLGDQAVDERDAALEKEHQEITRLFGDLCQKLDALSNFHYTPKAPKPEMVIVSNAAAISMEEVIPVNVADGTLLAPEEVYDKKRGEVKATTEMDQDERKRLRAHKKKLARKEKDLKEKEQKIIHKYNPKMAEKAEKKKAVKDLLSAKNVTLIGKDGKQQKTQKTVTSASLF